MFLFFIFTFFCIIFINFFCSLHILILNILLFTFIITIPFATLYHYLTAIIEKNPIVSMCVIGNYETIADVVGPEYIASSILPTIQPMLVDRYVLCCTDTSVWTKHIVLWYSILCIAFLLYSLPSLTSLLHSFSLPLPFSPSPTISLSLSLSPTISHSAQITKQAAICLRSESNEKHVEKSC